MMSRLWIVSLAGVVGVVCGLCLFQRQSPPLESEQPAGEVEILVASQRIPRETFLKRPEQFFHKRRVNAALMPKGALTSLDQIKAWCTARELHEGDPVTDADFADFEWANFPREPGTVLVNLVIDMPTVILGFWAAPGSRCSVVLELPRTAGPETAILVREVLVVAQSEFVHRGRLKALMTVRVNENEEELLTLAKGNFSLRLTLPESEQESLSLPQLRRLIDESRTSSIQAIEWTNLVVKPTGR